MRSNSIFLLLKFFGKHDFTSQTACSLNSFRQCEERNECRCCDYGYQKQLGQETWNPLTRSQMDDMLRSWCLSSSSSFSGWHNFRHVLQKLASVQCLVSNGIRPPPPKLTFVAVPSQLISFVALKKCINNTNVTVWHHSKLKMSHFCPNWGKKSKLQCFKMLHSLSLLSLFFFYERLSNTFFIIVHTTSILPRSSQR